MRSLLTKTFFYPYQIFFKTEKDGNESILREYAKGTIVDIGCGSANYKDFCLALSQVSSYLPMDYPTWGANFKDSINLASELGVVGSTLLRSSPNKALAWVDGTELAIKSESVETVLSLGVLEHIRDYRAYLSEATRVLKKDGNFIITIPFLYQAHGGQDGVDDYYRWTMSGLKYDLEKSGLKCVVIEGFGGPGTMFSQLINGYLIKKLNLYSGKNKILKLLFFGILLAPVFFLVNSISFIIEKLDKDRTFASGFRAVGKKG